MWVNHDLLVEKLSLYGMDDGSTEWVRSYLGGRSQSVSIEGSLSKLLHVHTGVPQGSILGPLFYTLFTNELPEVIHDHNHLQGPSDNEEQGDQVWPAYHVEDKENGAICCYADDTTFSIADPDPDLRSTNLLLSSWLTTD